MSYRIIPGGVTSAEGFLAAGVHCGIRKNKTKRDLADALLQDRNTAQTLTLADLKELVAIKESNISSDSDVFYA